MASTQPELSFKSRQPTDRSDNFPISEQSKFIYQKLSILMPILQFFSQFYCSQHECWLKPGGAGPWCGLSCFQVSPSATKRLFYYTVTQWSVPYFSQRGIHYNSPTVIGPAEAGLLTNQPQLGQSPDRLILMIMIFNLSPILQCHCCL